MEDWTMESVIEALGDEAQVVPGGVIKHHLNETTGQQSNVLIAEYHDGAFCMTPEGRSILGPRQLELTGLELTKAGKMEGSTPLPRKRRTKAEMALAAMPTFINAPVPSLAPEPIQEQGELDFDVDDLDLPDDMLEELDPEA